MMDMTKIMMTIMIVREKDSSFRIKTRESENFSKIAHDELAPIGRQRS